jgi:hypothetical protein
MSLRLRLIVAFFVLSVVPLAAVTYFTYTNNVKAVQAAASREANLLADELNQRMQLVTAQLSERVEHLVSMPPPATKEVTVAAVKPQSQKPGVTKPTSSATSSAATQTDDAQASVNVDAMNAKVAEALGAAAMLLNKMSKRADGHRPAESSAAPVRSKRTASWWPWTWRTAARSARAVGSEEWTAA